MLEYEAPVGKYICPLRRFRNLSTPCRSMLCILYISLLNLHTIFLNRPLRWRKFLRFDHPTFTVTDVSISSAETFSFSTENFLTSSLHQRDGVLSPNCTCLHQVKSCSFFFFCFFLFGCGAVIVRAKDIRSTRTLLDVCERIAQIITDHAFLWWLTQTAAYFFLSSWAEVVIFDKSALRAENRHSLYSIADNLELGEAVSAIVEVGEYELKVNEQNNHFQNAELRNRSVLNKGCRDIAFSEYKRCTVSMPEHQENTRYSA